MRRLALGFGLLLLVATGAQTHDQEIHGVLKKRHDIMQTIGNHMRYLGGIARGRQAFDQAKVNEIGSEISVIANEFLTLFSDASEEEVGSRAGSAIFSDPEGFKAEVDGLVAAANTLAKVARPNEFDVAFPQLAKTCNACHDIYRKSN